MKNMFSGKWWFIIIYRVVRIYLFIYNIQAKPPWKSWVLGNILNCLALAPGLFVTFFFIIWVAKTSWKELTPNLLLVSSTQNINTKDFGETGYKWREWSYLRLLICHDYLGFSLPICKVKSWDQVISEVSFSS